MQLSLSDYAKASFFFNCCNGRIFVHFFHSNDQVNLMTLRYACTAMTAENAYNLINSTLCKRPVHRNFTWYAIKAKSAQLTETLTPNEFPTYTARLTTKIITTLINYHRLLRYRASQTHEILPSSICDCPIISEPAVEKKARWLISN